MRGTSRTTSNLNADDLLSFQLRGRLAEINFFHIWRVIQSQPSHMRWTFNNNIYITPNGTNLGTAKEAMEILDSYALEGLTFRNNQSRESQMNDGGENLNELKKVRRDLLTAIYEDCKESNSILPCYYFDKDDEISEDEISDDEEEDIKPKPITIRSKSRMTKYVSTTANEPGTDAYFEKKAKPKKVQKPEKNVQNEEGEEEQLFQELKWPSPKKSAEYVEQLSKDGDETLRSNAENKYLKQYSSKWRFLLTTNHSLLLFGYGSKKKLLNDFAFKELEPDGDVLTLNGFDPEINISQILDVMVQLFLNGVEPSAKPLFEASAEVNMNDVGLLRTPYSLNPAIVKRAISIGKALGAQYPKPIYLVIHNIDGVGLRGGHSQRALSALLIHSIVVDDPKRVAKFEDSRVVRIVASVDHVDVPLFLWDLETLNNFSWIWKEVKTWDPYYDEIKFGIAEQSRKARVTEIQNLDFVFMQKVLKSVAPKHTDIIKVLAKMQLEDGGKHPALSVDHDYVRLDKWQNKCFQNYDVSKTSEFQSMVKELSDHNMIQIKSVYSVGADFVCIPTSKAKVKEILKSL